MAGVLALVGGNEWQEKCTFDRGLLEASGGKEVVVLPTAAAYEHPQRAVDHATKWFESLGGTVRGLDVLRRQDAEDESNAAAVRGATFIYLSGGSPMHVQSVLKDSPVWQALAGAGGPGGGLAGVARRGPGVCGTRGGPPRRRLTLRARGGGHGRPPPPPPGGGRGP